MNIFLRFLIVMFFVLTVLTALGQPCDPSVAPSGLTAVYTPGTGVLLQWNAVPSSAGVALRAYSPSGSIVKQRLMGVELDQYLVPEAKLTPGFYLWQVQAGCSSISPFVVTPPSEYNSFTVSSANCPATLTDLDGNVYNAVQIGSQCWMAENLRTSFYSNGDSIPTGLDNSGWSSTTSGAYAIYNNDTANKVPYGLLYNWYTVEDARGVCPLNWHVPTDDEWSDLKYHLRLLGGPAGAKMKATGTLEAGTGLWQTPNKEASNLSGFSGLPAGVRNYIGNYYGQGLVGIWWSSTEASSDFAWIRFMAYDNEHLGRNDDIKEVGQSVRCIKD